MPLTTCHNGRVSLDRGNDPGLEFMFMLTDAVADTSLYKVMVAVRDPRTSSDTALSKTFRLEIGMTLKFNWGEPERAPHRRETHARIVYIYGTTVTRGAARTQYTVRIPKYSVQYRPHVVMFASSTAQACNIHCHVFKHRSSYACALVLIVIVEFRNEDIKHGIIKRQALLLYISPRAEREETSKTRERKSPSVQRL